MERHLFVIKGVVGSNPTAGTNDVNKLDESYKLTIWDNVPDSACFERLAVLSRPRPAHHLDHASRQRAPVEHSGPRAHRPYLREEASVATSDQGTLSSAAAITRAIPAPAMT